MQTFVVVIYFGQYFCGLFCSQFHTLVFFFEKTVPSLVLFSGDEICVMDCLS